MRRQTSIPLQGLVLRPHKAQFVIDELPFIVLCCGGGIYGGMDGVPYPAIGVAVFLCLSIVLLYRFSICAGYATA